MATITKNCTYSNPVKYDGTVPTLPTHAFYFKNSVCTDDATTTQTFTFEAYNPSSTIATTSDIKVYGSMSAGEVLIALFLFIIISIKMIELLARALDNIKTRKTFIRYTNNEAEISDNL